MSRKKPAYYCYECLKKVGPKYVREVSDECSNCGCKLRKLKNSRTRAQTVTRLARLRGLISPRNKPDYDRYLDSDEWRILRRRILDRDENTCQDCGDAAMQVHHLSYSWEVMAGKDDTQLVSLCKPCHYKRHPKYHPENRKKKRKRKRPRASAGSHSGPVDPPKANAGAVPTSGEIGQYETGLSLAKGR